jgi:hypothetical protein
MGTAEKQPESLDELVAKRDALLKLKEAINNRLANLSREEILEMESLSRRGLNPNCPVDRKYSGLPTLRD